MGRQWAGGLVMVALFITTGCGPGELKSFAPAGATWTAMFPGEPKEQTQSAGGVSIKMYTVEERNAAYMVGVADMPLPDNMPAAEIQERLKGARDGAVANVGGTLKNDKQIMLGGKYPGIELTATISRPRDGVVRQRIYFVGKRMYQILAVGNESTIESDHTTKFLDSLQVTN